MPAMLTDFTLLCADEPTAAWVATLGLPTIVAQHRTFADGEQQYWLPHTLPAHLPIAVVGTGTDIVLLAQLAAAARLAGAPTVWGFIPYLPYMRQDKPEQIAPHATGVPAGLPAMAPASFAVIGQLLGGFLQGVFTYTPHSATGLKLWPSTCPIVDLDGLHILGAAVKNTLSNQPLTVVACDAGSTARAQQFADLLGGAAVAQLAKTRAGPNHIASMVLQHGHLSGRHAVLLDDIIDTAGTLCAAAHTCRTAGAVAVSAAAVHGVFSHPAPTRLAQAGFAHLWCLHTRQQAAPAGVICLPLSAQSFGPTPVPVTRAAGG
jgi:ribose-phosphate pyrophosphokinase